MRLIRHSPPLFSKELFGSSFHETVDTKSFTRMADETLHLDFHAVREVLLEKSLLLHRPGICKEFLASGIHGYAMEHLSNTRHELICRDFFILEGIQYLMNERSAFFGLYKDTGDTAVVIQSLV